MTKSPVWLYLLMLPACASLLALHVTVLPSALTPDTEAIPLRAQLECQAVYAHVALLAATKDFS